MAAWDISEAVSSLRSLLGDGPTDKYEFKSDAIPATDGITKRFFCGQTRVVPGSLQIHLAGVAVQPAKQPEYGKGVFELATAPSGSQSLQASFCYQWFGDADLQEFLQNGAKLLNLTGIADTTLPESLRPVVLEFACYYACARKAVESADAVAAAAAGYQIDQTRAGPNWRDMAKTFWEMAKAHLEMWEKNPLSGTTKPQMQFASFVLPDYMPGS